jgi:hypothetical protein
LCRLDEEAGSPSDGAQRFGLAASSKGRNDMRGTVIAAVAVGGLVIGVFFAVKPSGNMPASTSAANELLKEAHGARPPAPTTPARSPAPAPATQPAANTAPSARTVSQQK